MGQDQVLGADTPLRRMVEKGRIPSLILWGPPGSGKTTVARLLARHTSVVVPRRTLQRFAAEDLGLGSGKGSTVRLVGSRLPIIRRIPTTMPVRART